MSAQPTAQTYVHTSTPLNVGPYAEVPTEVLADALEAQYDQGEPLTPEMVFELVGRLMVAEGLVLPATRG